MQRLTTCLWFDGDANEAAEFYCKVFGGSITSKSGVVTGFEMRGQQFLAMNGGPKGGFTPAVSFVVNCETQEEVDRYWDALTAEGGRPGKCGWLQDRHGVSWQVVPSVLPTLMSDPEKSQNVMKKFQTMGKIIIAELTE